MLSTSKIANAPEEFLKINLTKKEIILHVNVFTVLDNGYFVSIIPSLNLSGYGQTPDESKNMLNEIVHDYLLALTKLSYDQIAIELKKLGWNRNRIKNKEFIKSYVDPKGILREFDLDESSIIESNLVSY